MTPPERNRSVSGFVPDFDPTSGCHPRSRRALSRSSGRWPTLPGRPCRPPCRSASSRTRCRRGSRAGYRRRPASQPDGQTTAARSNVPRTGRQRRCMRWPTGTTPQAEGDRQRPRPIPLRTRGRRRGRTPGPTRSRRRRKPNRSRRSPTGARTRHTTVATQTQSNHPHLLNGTNRPAARSEASPSPMAAHGRGGAFFAVSSSICPDRVNTVSCSVTGLVIRSRFRPPLALPWVVQSAHRQGAEKR